MFPDTHHEEADVLLDAAAVLLVDDDPQWARATARLLETAEPALDVTIADSLTAGRRAVRDGSWACVVCDYQLGDGTGFDLVETVDEATTHCPFLLVTGRGDEQVASRAIRRGVTDYVIKRNDDGEATLLANRVRNAIVSARLRRQVAREYRGKTAILDLLRSTTLSEGLLAQFCRIVVEQNGYTGAWIGAIDAGSDAIDASSDTTVVPQAVEGCGSYLETVADTTGVGIDSVDPAGAALARDEPVVVSSTDAPAGAISSASRVEADKWAPVARDYGFVTAAALPITHDGVRLGVLCVYRHRDDPPVTPRRWAVLTEYADVIGHAQQHAELKQSLLAEPTLRVDVEVTDPAAPLAELTAGLGRPSFARVRSTLRRDDGTAQYLTTIADASVDVVEAVARNADTFTVTSPTATAGGVQCDVHTTVVPPAARLVSHGVTVETVSAADGTVHLTLSAPDHATATAATDVLKSAYETVTVTALWDADPPAPSESGSPLESLTEKQETVLHNAYVRGYFERPREVSATELAERLGIARATMTQHLRAAQRKLFDEMFDR